MKQLMLLSVTGFVLNYFCIMFSLQVIFLSYSLLYKISIQISLGFVKAIRYMLTSTFMVQNLRMRN